MRPAAPAPDSLRARFVFNPAAVIVVCAIGLVALGLTILFSATMAFKAGPYSYLTKQIVGLALATGVAVVVSRVNLENARRHVKWIGGLSLLALALVLIPHIGITVKGSRRWLGFGAARFQVSELGKIAMVFCLAHYLAINQSRILEFKRGYLLPLALIGAFAGLMLCEPDFGTAALTIAVGVLLLFLAGLKWRYILLTVPLVVVGLAVLVIHNPNRRHRMEAYLGIDTAQVVAAVNKAVAAPKVGASPGGASNTPDAAGAKNSGTYQLDQSLAAFAAGGTDGAGLGQGRQQLHFLPEAQTDFIFAIIGEELGLRFTLGVVAVFAIMFAAGLVHLRKAPNLFQYLLVTGCLLLICLQAIINLGVVTGLFPTKGMSMPFISAGLSNLLLMGALVGVIVNTQRAWTRPAFAKEERSMKELVA